MLFSCCSSSRVVRVVRVARVARVARLLFVLLLSLLSWPCSRPLGSLLAVFGAGQAVKVCVRGLASPERDGSWHCVFCPTGLGAFFLVESGRYRRRWRGGVYGGLRVTVLWSDEVLSCVIV